MSKRLRTLCISACLAYLALSFASAAAFVRSYVEDFTTMQYCDTLNTTALWDTVAGEVKLPPFELTLAGSYDTPGLAYGVAISGDYAYVADRYWGLLAIDISNPASPTLAGSCGAPDDAYGVAISGDYAYVAGGDSGLQVIDISNPASLTLAGSYDTPGLACGVAISGDYAYVADEYSGLQVIDISDPTNPTFEATCDTPGYAYGVAIWGDYAYVADGGSGLQVIDISSPASPTLAGSYNTPDFARCVAISGDYAYVADGFPGLQVIDISDPTSPTLAGTCDTLSYPSGVAISGDYAYIAGCASRLQVIDISDPTCPTLAGTFDTPDWAHGVAISGDYAYIADWDLGGLQVIDISDPTNPDSAGSCYTPYRAYDVAISGDYAFVADGLSGLQVIDISDPTSPTLAGSYDTPDNATDVAISGDYAYVADVESGLQVIEVFQRRYDIQSNTAQSLTVDEADEMILKACLNGTYSDSIRWELSADSGSSWQEFLPGGAYQTFVTTGSELLWRSSHFYTGGGINPTCSSLLIEWLYEFPVVESITDIPNDQGRQVRITWTRSGYDIGGSSTPITEYAIFRRIDQVLASSVPALGPKRRAVKTERVMEDPQGLVTYPPGDWDFVKTVPAYGEDSYSTVVPTLVDSTQSEGIKYSILFVRAGTYTPSVYFDSYPDSGYSVDNLAPAPPPDFRMTSPTNLAWDEAQEEDFSYFSVYGSGTAGLDSTATLIGYTIGTTMDIPDDIHDYYHVTATDFAGNEGEASSVENTYAGAGHVEDLPQAFALKPNKPNPFESATVIAFDLPKPSAVRLEVVDVQGRVVRILTDEAWPAGHHSIVWNGDNDAGEATGSGVYFVRIQAGGFTAKTKMLRMR